MPSAHGPIFVVRNSEKRSGWRSDFFVGPIFYRTKSQRTRTDFLSELLSVTIAGEVPLLDCGTPIFYRTEVSAHGPIFCQKQLREIIGAILYQNKSQRTRTDFHSDFKSVRVCWALNDTCSRTKPKTTHALLRVD